MARAAKERRLGEEEEEEEGSIRGWRTHAGSTSDNKTSISDNQTLSPATHAATRGHLVELLLDLEHFVIATHGFQRSLERGEDFSQKKEGSAA